MEGHEGRGEVSLVAARVFGAHSVLGDELVLRLKGSAVLGDSRLHGLELEHVERSCEPIELVLLGSRTS